MSEDTLEYMNDAMRGITESQRKQLYYLAVCLKKYPDLTIPQVISQAKKFTEGETVPFSTANLTKCLKEYATKK